MLVIIYDTIAERLVEHCQPQTPTLMRCNPGESMWLTFDV
jgi:hypothetical protein